MLPEVPQSSGLQSFFRHQGLTWEFIPPYSPSQGGAWESLIKVFKRTLTNTVNLIHRKPTLVELQTYTSNATRLVNDRPLTAQSDDPLDYNAISPSSLLTPSLDPVLPIGQVHDRDHLRRDYRYNCSLAQQFWERWVSSIFHSYNVVRSGSNSHLTFESARWYWLGGPEKLTNEVIIALDVLLAYIRSGIEVERLYAELLSRFLFLIRQPESTKLLK